MGSELVHGPTLWQRRKRKENYWDNNPINWGNGDWAGNWWAGKGNKDKETDQSKQPVEETKNDKVNKNAVCTGLSENFL